MTTLYSDNGGEFIALAKFLASNGISHFTSPPHTPEHNGMAERRHRHIVETGLSLLTHAGMPNTYWSYSFAAAVYLINRMPTPVLHGSSPFELLFQQAPNYMKLRSFGCLCYPWLRPYSQHKLTPKSTPCIFLGYSLTQSAYLCLDLSKSRVYTSRHVEFCENNFPFLSLSSNLVSSVPSIESSSSQSPTASIVPIYHQPLTSSISPPAPPEPTPQIPSPTETTDTTTTISTSSTAASTSTLLAAPSRPVTRSMNQIVKPNPKYGLFSQLAEIEPTTITQALKDEKWRHSCGDEINAMTRTGTWDLVPAEQAQNVVGCRWVFRIKRLPDGSVERYKSRLVAKGFHQRPGVDFEETYSPVIKHATIRLVLDVAVKKNWDLCQLDVNNAFLQGTLNEEVYLTQPPGFIDKDHPDYVCRLKKAIYGLKQAPRAWYNEIRQFLLTIGFTNSLADASLFVYNKARVYVYLLLYVDDIVITGSCSNTVSQLIKALSTRFSLKDLGQLSYFLGIEILRTAAGLRLTQQKYTTDLLSRTNMAHAKPVQTPMCSTQALVKKGINLGDLEAKEYRDVVGSLQYLSFTRPDIAFAVNRLSQFMHCPTTEHWDAAKRVLRYLAGTVTQGITLRANSPLTITAYSDADWGGDKDDLCSTNAYIVYLGTSPISWASRKQKGVARSSTEAEYRAVAATASEVKWLCSVLSELGIQLPQVPVVHCDNIGATYLCANPVFHSRMKHIAIDYHFVRELVQQGYLRVSHITTTDQLADALTKPLPRTRFLDLAVKIGVSSGTPS